MLVKAGLRNLLRNPRRTLGIVFAVMLGTGSLFLVHGFNSGIKNQYRYNAIHGFFADGEVRPAGYGDKVYERPWEHWIADEARVEGDLRRVAGVREVFPRASLQGLLSAGDHVVAGAGIGVHGAAESRYFTTINMEEGRDLEDTADGIVLGRELARVLHVRLGDRVTVLAQDVHGSLNGADFHVTGIFHTGNQAFDASAFRVQLPKVKELLDTDGVERMQVSLAEDVGWSAVTSHLPPGGALEAIPFEVLDKVNYGNTVSFLAAQFNIIRLVVLIVVVLGLTSVLAASIFERRTEIGTLRANGESHLDVLTLLGVESLAMGALGGLAGVLYGLFVTHVLVPHGILMPAAPGLTRQFHILIELQPDMAVEVVALGVVIVLAASYFAVRRVLRASVAELLRST